MPNKYILINNGKSDWKITIGGNASVSEHHAANELQKYLLQISGVLIPIIRDANSLNKHEILVGESIHLSLIDPEMNLKVLGKEGFIIKMTGDYLIIAGGKLRGTLYGVYTFLEKYLGCRWFSYNVSSIPQKTKIELQDIYDIQVPKFNYRECYYDFQAIDGDWSARNKLNGNFHELKEKHGKKIKFSPFVHTFNDLVPVEKYYDTHPEYFSEINGVRTGGETQLCLANEEVFEIALSTVKQWIAEDKDLVIISVSQNDCITDENNYTHYNYCQCKSCRKIDEEEGSPSGSILKFVNRIAEAIEKINPDIYIETLAYMYSRKPPKNIRPRKNVIIRLCSIECCFSHPIEDCHIICSCKNHLNEGIFLEDLKKWSSICDNIYIWDYIVNFYNYVMPFPNLHVLQPNIQFFMKNGVKGVFEQGNYSKGGGGEFAELRAYIIAKLLWNPDEDIDFLINDFLNGFYGRAATPIRKYIDMLINKVTSENIHMGIFDPPTIKYLSEDILDQADRLFDEAEILADNREVMARIRLARLPIKYVKIVTMPLDSLDREVLIEDFCKAAQEFGITYIGEHTPFTREYITNKTFYIGKD